MTSALNICFVKKDMHEIAKSKFKHLSEHLIKLNNYDHVTSELFKKLQATLDDPSLSRFKKPIPKICLACCKYLGESDDNKNKHEEASTLPQSSDETTFHKLLYEIKTRPFTEAEMSLLMEAVGERLTPFVHKHVVQLNKTNLGNRLDDMKTMTYQSYWENSCGVLKHFFAGTINGLSKRIETEETRKSRIRLGIHAMETMFAITNLNYTSAITLTEMLYMYFLSNSRRVCDIYGAVTGGGSSTTLRNALEKISKKPTKFPGSGYVVVAFDNNQVLAKTHRVELDSKLKISVVTSLAAFELLNSDNPQKRKMSFPLLYQLSPNDSHALNQKLQQFTSQSIKLVNEYLVKFLKRRLTFIEASISENGLDYVDGVSSDSDIPKGNFLPYDDVSEMPSPCRIYDQECLLVNPNSYKTVSEVLVHIQKIALCEGRQWVTIVVDGIPFSLAQDIIRKSVYCNICNEVLLEKDVSNHYITTHEQPSPSHLERVFKNILLRPGAGHYEMNMVKALFSGWFPLYIEPVAELLGFKSPKAKWFVQNCTDHHKAWQILEITFESISDELLHSYVKSCRLNATVPSVDDFIENVNGCENENVKAAFQFAFYWCFSIMLFRGGIRKNNFEVAIKAREQGSGLFYGFRHPKYQLINCQDIAELVQMPADIRSAVYRESMVIPGSNVGQGIDFLLEQRNRRMKSYVVRNGIPTSEQWRAASASMQNLDEIIDKVEDRLNLKTTSSHHKLDHSREIKAARSIFRRNGLLDISKTANISFLPGIQYDNKPYNSILRCQLLSESNRRMFYEGTVTSGKATVSSYISLFKSDNETEEVNSFGITKLRAATKTMSKYLSKELQKEINSELRSSDKDKLKETYWRVYNLIEEEEDEIF